MNRGPRQTLRLVTGAGLSVAVLGVLAWPVLASVLDRAAVLRCEPSAASLTVANYIAIGGRIPLLEVFSDSGIVAVLSSILAVALAVPCAYAVSRGASAWLYPTAVSLWLVPAVTLSFEVYVWFVRTGLYDTFIGMILLHALLGSTLAIVLLVPIFDSIPRRQDELAARRPGSIRLLVLVDQTALGCRDRCVRLERRPLLERAPVCWAVDGSRGARVSVCLLALTTVPTWGEVNALLTIALVPALVCWLAVVSPLAPRRLQG